MQSDTAPKLIPAADVIAQLPIGKRTGDRAAKAALRRLINRANDTRHDRKQPPLKAIRIGKSDYYKPDFVDQLISSL